MCAIVAEALSSKRFKKIKSMFYLVDNQSLPAADSKMAKVLPLYYAINEAFVQFGVFHLYLNIDKSMVPYFGHHSCKMFICGKPIRFGFNGCHVKQTVIRNTFLHTVVEIRGMNWSIYSVQESSIKCYKWFKHTQIF